MDWLIFIVVIIIFIISIWKYFWIGIIIYICGLIIWGIIRYVVNHKTIEVSSKNKEARRINRIRSEEARRINRIRKNEEKEHKKMLSVARLGRLGASLDTINQQLDFMQVVHKEVVECKTIVEYENFTLKHIFRRIFLKSQMCSPNYKTMWLKTVRFISNIKEVFLHVMILRPIKKLNGFLSVVCR